MSDFRECLAGGKAYCGKIAKPPFESRGAATADVLTALKFLSALYYKECGWNRGEIMYFFFVPIFGGEVFLFS